MKKGLLISVGVGIITTTIGVIVGYQKGRRDGESSIIKAYRDMRNGELMNTELFKMYCDDILEQLGSDYEEPVEEDASIINFAKYKQN